ncbi:ras-related protein Rab-5A-like [Glandiceps talaboti]
MSSSNKTRFRQVKVVLLGDHGVGKTSIILRLVKGKFGLSEPTLTATYWTQRVCLNNTVVQFQIWDTVGEEKYHSLTKLYFRGAKAAIVVYDVTKEDSLTSANSWIEELERQATADMVIALVGNKADLIDRRLIKNKNAQTLANSKDLIFMEVSAKTGMNVNELFLALAKKFIDCEPTPLDEETIKIHYNDEATAQPTSKNCCKS